MSPLSVALLLVMITGSALVQSTTGFGFGIVSMSFLPYMMTDYMGATALAGLGALATSLFVAVKNVKNAQWKVILPVICGYTFSNVLTVRVAKGFSSDSLTAALGVMLILMSIYFMFFNNKFKIKPTLANGVIAGLLGGVGAGLFSIGGPPVVVYILSATDDKELYRASQLTYFSMSGIISTTVRWANGIVTGEVLMLFALSLVGIVLGTYLGGKIFHRVNADLLKKMIYGVMALSGVTMLF